MLLKTNLRELNALNPAIFANDLIICQSDYLDKTAIYLHPEYNKIQGNVPLDRVVGHSQMYDEMTWGDCLAGRYLKRIDSGLRWLEANPSYYLDSSPKEGVAFTKIGNDYFIITGKHRTVIARFLQYYNQNVFASASPLSNVSIFERTVDYQYMALIKEVDMLKELYPNLEFVMEYTHSNEELCLSVHPRRYGMPSGFFTRSELTDCISDFKKPSLMKKLNSSKTHQFVSYSDCLKSFFRTL